MVSLGDSGLGLPQHAAATQPLLATSAVPATSLFPIHKLRPRDGLTMGRHKFQRDALALLAAFGLPPEAVNEEPPAIRVSPSSSSSASRNNSVGAAAGDVPSLQAQQDHLAAWQRVNTALYWHLLPAIDLDGPHYLEDSALVDSFVSGQRASGRKLLRWALDFGDVSSFSAQLALSVAVAQVRVTATVTLSQLAAHLHKVHQVWRLTANADPGDRASLTQLWEYVLTSLPSSYSDSKAMHLVSLRSWLADKLTDYKAGGGAILSDYSVGVKALLEHGATLGMSAGDAVPQGNLLAVISKPDGVQWKVNWNSGGTSAGSLMPLNAGGSHQRNKPGSGDRSDDGHRKGNNCSYCPAQSCRSNDFAEKAAKCISRHNSTFDITKLSPGKQMVVKVLREYDKAHPNATSLKQVDLKVKGGCCWQHQWERQWGWWRRPAC